MHYVAEGVLGMEYGFWGCIAAGGHVKITKATHRRGARGRTGRGFMRDHAGELLAGESAVGQATKAWKAGEKSPTTKALRSVRSRWNAVPLGGTLVLHWPPRDDDLRSRAD
jgi:hypothetical protein